MKKHHCFIRAVFVIAGLLLIPFLLVLSPSFLTHMANHKLSAMFNGPASVQWVALHPVEQCIDFSGLRIDEPASIGTGTVCYIKQGRVHLALWSLFSPERVFESIALCDVALHVVLNKHKKVNLAGLLVQKDAHKIIREIKRTALSRISIHALHVTNACIDYTDESVRGDPLHIVFTNTDLSASRLLLAEFELLKTSPAEVIMTADILQDSFAKAPFGLFAEVGRIGRGIPSMNAAVRIADVELRPIMRILPPETEHLLGGNALDLFVNMAISEESLAVRIQTKTVGASTMTFNITGTPHHPKFDTSNILFDILSRTGGGMGSMLASFLSAGEGGANTAINALDSVGQGVYHIASSETDGLLNTADGIVHGDVNKAGQGLNQSTWGVVDETGRAIGNATRVVTEGVDQAVRDLFGDNLEQQWRQNSRQRWEPYWTNAQQEVKHMPFPPE